MSNQTGKIGDHQFHGAPERFEVVAGFIYEYFGKKIRYIADVAGGRGMLTRILNKKYGYESEVIDPRGYTLVGTPSRKEEFKAEMAKFYDLIVGLHPDEATKEVARAAIYTSTLLIPCCNFWDKTKKLGRDALIDEITQSYKDKKIKYEIYTFQFNSPKNIGVLTISSQIDIPVFRMSEKTEKIALKALKDYKDGKTGNITNIDKYLGRIRSSHSQSWQVQKRHQ
jgi:hypothetical protein